MLQGILWAVLTSPVPITKRYKIGEPHHITLLFGVERDDYRHYEGLSFAAFITEECWNDRIQALRVQLPYSVPFKGDRTPHITVSMIEGVEPVEANTMLKAEHESRSVGLEVRCRVEFLEWEC